MEMRQHLLKSFEPSDDIKFLVCMKKIFCKISFTLESYTYSVM